MGSAGSINSGRRTRKVSTTRLRVIVRAQVLTEARRRSSIDPWRHPRMNASWVVSCASAGSPSMVTARPTARLVATHESGSGLFVAYGNAGEERFAGEARASAEVSPHRLDYVLAGHGDCVQL